jgi:molybdenum cofactor biosynthesis enzyme MoaA
MSLPTVLTRLFDPLKQQSRIGVRKARTYFGIVQHSTAAVLPQVIQPDPQEIYITLTADCNLRCQGCRYGRDFMAGSQLPWETVRDLLDDCKSLGIRNIRLYGGEPLLHRDIIRIVEHSSSLGLHTWLTTNGILLKKKADALYDAGLRRISIGFYGTNEGYDAYVQKKDMFPRLEEGIAYLRKQFGNSVAMHSDGS